MVLYKIGISGTADPIAGGVEFDRVILGKNANADNSYLQGFIDECAYEY